MSTTVNLAELGRLDELVGICKQHSSLVGLVKRLTYLSCILPANLPSAAVSVSVGLTTVDPDHEFSVDRP